VTKIKEEIIVTIEPVEVKRIEEVIKDEMTLFGSSRVVIEEEFEK
jgi:hypothetical protein